MKLATHKKGVIYTCLTGKYDDLVDHTYTDNLNWDYICFTDDYSVRNAGNLKWELRKLQFKRLDKVRNQRWHKLHPHKLFPEYEISIYIDTNVNILNSSIFNDFEHAISKQFTISIGPHFERVCLYDELEACIDVGKDVEKVMRRQIELIRKDGFPRKMGLFENNIIFRRHNNVHVIKLMNDWWFWIKKYSRRDQLSLTYVAWKNNTVIEPLTDTSYRYNPGIKVSISERHITKEELMAQKKRLNAATNPYDSKPRIFEIITNIPTLLKERIFPKK